MFKLIKVSGDSMSPTLLDGDILITTKPRAVGAGFIYVIEHSDLGRIVKRIDGFDKRGRAILSGDNPASTPSALLGSIERSRISGRAMFAYGKSGFRKLS